jgi:hypothetical protein
MINVVLQGTAATLKLGHGLVLGHDLDIGDNNPPKLGHMKARSGRLSSQLPQGRICAVPI